MRSRQPGPHQCCIGSFLITLSVRLDTGWWIMASTGPHLGDLSLAFPCEVCRWLCADTKTNTNTHTERKTTNRSQAIWRPHLRCPWYEQITKPSKKFSGILRQSNLKYGVRVNRRRRFDTLSHDNRREIFLQFFEHYAIQNSRQKLNFLVHNLKRNVWILLMTLFLLLIALFTYSPWQTAKTNEGIQERC